MTGSSPQARGTRFELSNASKVNRFIPASAGNTFPPRRSAMLTTGSSPQARGTRANVMAAYRGDRFIPASAGNTDMSGLPGHRCPVHPRKRGEHEGRDRTAKHLHGSSPQARGTRAGVLGWRAVVRFIPASAGNTTARPHPNGTRSVHPRKRGEHALDRAVMLCLCRFIPASAGNTARMDGGPTPSYGSSPQARGTH